MDQNQFHELLKKYRQGRCTFDERKIIDDWYSAISTAEKPFFNVEDENRSKKASWAGLERYIAKTSPDEIPSTKNTTFKHWSIISIAASLGFLLMAGFFMKTRINSDSVIAQSPSESPPGIIWEINESAESVDFSLPEGSKITLFPGSKISFSESFTGPERRIFLEGEAFFDVTPDKNRPFLVYTNDLTTKVLGTSFLIRAFKQQKETVVAVRTGKVSVYPNTKHETRASDSHQEIILTANQQLIYDSSDQAILKQLVNKPVEILPQDRTKYQYTNAPVIEILNSLTETYGIDIRYDAAELANCTLTSDLSGEGFMEQIKIICNALGAEYKVSETSVIVKATGCNAY